MRDQEDEIGRLCSIVADRIGSEITFLECAVRGTQCAIETHRHGARCRWLKCARKRAERKLRALKAEILKLTRCERMLARCEHMIKTGSMQEMVSSLDPVIEHFEPSFLQKYVEPLGILADPRAILSAGRYWGDFCAMKRLRSLCAQPALFE